MVQSDQNSDGCCAFSNKKKQYVNHELQYIYIRPLTYLIIRKLLVMEESFNDVLTNTDLYRRFEEFLRSEHCSEALYFYKDTTIYHNNESRDRMEMKREVDELMEKYFDADSPTFVYIPEYLSAEVWSGKDYPHRELFEDARLDVESLLRTKFVAYCRVQNNSD